MGSDPNGARPQWRYEFAPLERWLRLREIALPELQAPVDQTLDQIRQQVLEEASQPAPAAN